MGATQAMRQDMEQGLDLGHGPCREVNGMPLSPMMQHYMTMKEQYKDCLLFYRLGDFYEMFFDDALLASKELEITLTSRDCGLQERAPMCGVPYHAVNSYVQRLIEKGHNVAICEQMTDPALSKGLVEREVVRIITPGTVIEDGMLEEKRNNYLLAMYLEEQRVGYAYADVSTGELLCAQSQKEERLILGELARIEPREILLCASDAPFFNKLKLPCTPVIRPDEDFDQQHGLQSLRKRLKDKPRNLGKLGPALCAVDGLLIYLDLTQKNALRHINSLKVYRRETHLLLDSIARRNLELTENLQTRKKVGSLLGLMDKTKTSMGGRLLRLWIEEPLCDREEIGRRQDAVAELLADELRLGELRELLSNVQDIERLLGRIAYGSANARDLLALRNSIGVVPALRACLSEMEAPYLAELFSQLDTLSDLQQLLQSALAEDPPLTVREGGIIKEGYSAELDELRSQAGGGREWLNRIEEAEREATGIKNLKIGYNKVFGYYIEVTKSFLSQVPYRYVRRQTLANCERYTTEELKRQEESILTAQDRSMKLEYNLFCEIRLQLCDHIRRFQQTASSIKTIDALQSLAQLALENRYCRPELHEGFSLTIHEGRHPVVEALSGDPFVPNDTFMDENGRLLIITGPNMAGKSTYMRQVALITLMAHVGSFVPAASARIPLCDQIFTRVGASDDLAAGQSTFMVEMNEMAQILAGATKRSLLILDEIGRGTSTFDGLAIAWACAEFIANNKRLGAKTLFATHYHELSELEGRLEGAVNYSIAVKEHGEEIIFLRKIQRGGADHSFGVQVASLAGLPAPLIARAREIMSKLEVNDVTNQISQNILEGKKRKNAAEQVNILEYGALDFAQEIAALDVNAMTPMDALNKLYTLREKARNL